MNRGQGPKATSGKPFITRGSSSSGATGVTSVNGATGAVTGLAPTASPTFTGTVDASGATVTLPSGLVLPASVSIPTSAVAVTQSAGDNSTKVATTAYADAIAALKANLASPTFTGTPAAPTAAQGTNTTQLATTAMVHSEAVLLAPIVSPTFTGTPAAPTAAAATNTTQIATTAQVQAAIAAQIGAVGGFAKTVIRGADSATIASNATPANDDTLLWAVGANDRWFFQAFLTFTAAQSAGTSQTEDVKVGWSVPASGTMQWGALGAATQNEPGYGSTAVANAPIVLLAAAGTLSSGMATGSIGLALCGFYTGGGTGGNVNLQWSQNTSDASTLLIAKNSMITAWRIA